jgi:hypothetical protein
VQVSGRSELKWAFTATSATAIQEEDWLDLFKNVGLTATSQYALRNAAILDSGANIHIFNDINRFDNYQSAPPGHSILVGNGYAPIKGYGEVSIKVKKRNSRRRDRCSTSILRLKDVAHCPDFVTNVVSLFRLHNQGYWLIAHPQDISIRRISDGSIVCNLDRRLGQYVVEDLPPSIEGEALVARRHQFNSWTARNPSQVDGDTWHHRLGHPGSEALQRTIKVTTGAKILGPTTVQCESCATAKITKQIRRTPREHLIHPGDRIAIDFHDFGPGRKGLRYVMLLTDRYSGYWWEYYLIDRYTKTIQAAMTEFLAHMDRQFDIKPKAVECDNEVKKTIKTFLRRQGIKVEPSAPHTPSQNGVAERTARHLKEKVLAMRTSSKLPTHLWPEICRAAVYLANRTARNQPHLSGDGAAVWKSPYEVFHTYIAHKNGFVLNARLPEVSHLKVFGCKAFAMTAAQQKGMRRKKEFAPKAWIGFLVGYSGTGIYRIWNPRTDKIIRMRDVIFNEDERFNGDRNTLERDDLLSITTEEISRMLKGLETLGLSEENITENSQPVFSPDEDLWEAPREQSRNCDRGEEEAEIQDVIYVGGQEPDSDSESSLSDPPSDVDQSEGQDAESETDLSDSDQSDSGGGAAKDSSDANPDAPAAVFFTQATGIIPNRLLPTQHLRLPLRPAPWKAAFVAGTQAEVVGTIDGIAVNKSQRERLRKKPPREPQEDGDKMNIDKIASQEEVARLVSTGDIFKVHRSRLPPPPRWHSELHGCPEPRPWRSKSWKDGKTTAPHPLGKLFEEAEEDHLRSHREMNSWIEVNATDVSGKQVLDCMWVYVYKFNKHGFFRKCKARLVVRGDQQPKNGQDETYAATLAGRSFRALIAIAARFDLEMKQFDAVNAFVNATLDETVYMRLPPGRRGRGDRVLLLKKALYGLRKSPLLWQRHLTNTLTTKIGFETVPQEPCALINNGVIVFFYVDDIVIAYRKEDEPAAQQYIESLKKCYNLTGGDDIQWFLGIEIIRDRENQLIWLSQSSYIDKIANLVDEKNDRAINVPMVSDELLPPNGRASKQSIKRYQRKIGSLLYAAIITRPDVAFAVSRLARFATNPGPEHHAAADRVLQYLKTHRGLALQFGGSDDFVVASDASFADNSIDRKSSQGYVMRLFGGLISWRASKQDTVTTSTTEAELLALSQAAKESMFMSRLFENLRVSLDDKTIRIQCDNKQTIRLVKAEIPSLQTKLKHVDIHNHWLRQEVENKTIAVEYTPSGDMIADGLTKALQSGKFETFRTQLGLVDVTDRLKERRSKELQEDDLEALLVGPE